MTPMIADMTTVLHQMLPGRSPEATIVAVGVLVVLSAWFSGMETGLYRFNRLRGKLLVREGHRQSVGLDRDLSDRQTLIAGLLLGNNLWNDLAATIVTLYFTLHPVSGISSEILPMIVLTPILFIFGETVPKAVFYARANDLMLRSRWPIAISCWLMRVTGLNRVFRGLARVVVRIMQRLTGQNVVETDSDELTMLLRESHAEGALSTVQSDIAERILTLPSVRIWKIMIPIDRVVSVAQSASRQQFIATVRDHPFTTIPLHGSDRRHVVAAVDTDALLASTTAAPADVAFAVLKMPASSSLLDVLSAMQRQHSRIAVIHDRTGQAAGLVTLGDLVKYLLD